MDFDEILEHARRLIRMHNEDYEYSLVYEDDELAEMTEEAWLAVHDAMYDIWEEEGL